MKHLLSSRMPVRSLLRIRPVAVGAFDKRKIGFWDFMDQPLGELFRENAPAVEDFLEEVSSARTAPNIDWASSPLYLLVDRLTQEHRDLLLQEVADISHLLDVHTLSDSPEASALRGLHREFAAFVKDLQSHIEEEEAFLFPKILRYEACFRDRRVHPEFHLGSVQTYTATRAVRNEDRLEVICWALADKARAAAREHPVAFAIGEVSEMLGRLGEKLSAHGHLEGKILLPVAGELERTLYNLTIGGDSASVYRRQGPLDSGILRLKEA